LAALLLLKRLPKPLLSKLIAQKLTTAAQESLLRPDCQEVAVYVARCAVNELKPDAAASTASSGGTSIKYSIFLLLKGIVRTLREVADFEHVRNWRWNFLLESCMERGELAYPCVPQVSSSCVILQSASVSIRLCPIAMRILSERSLCVTVCVCVLVAPATCHDQSQNCVRWSQVYFAMVSVLDGVDSSHIQSADKLTMQVHGLTAASIAACVGPALAQTATSTISGHIGFDICAAVAFLIKNYDGVFTDPLMSAHETASASDTPREGMKGPHAGPAAVGGQEASHGAPRVRTDATLGPRNVEGGPAAVSAGVGSRPASAPRKGPQKMDNLLTSLVEGCTGQQGRERRQRGRSRPHGMSAELSISPARFCGSCCSVCCLLSCPATKRAGRSPAESSAGSYDGVMPQPSNTDFRACGPLLTLGVGADACAKSWRERRPDWRRLAKSNYYIFKIVFARCCPTLFVLRRSVAWLTRPPATALRPCPFRTCTCKAMEQGGC
jgi:hypothetical protein